AAKPGDDADARDAGLHEAEVFPAERLAPGDAQLRLEEQQVGIAAADEDRLAAAGDQLPPRIVQCRGEPDCGAEAQLRQSLDRREAERRVEVEAIAAVNKRTVAVEVDP